MKVRAFAASVLTCCAILLPSGADASEGVTPSHVLDFGTKLPEQQGGITDVTFPITVTKAPGQPGWYWAQHFYFGGQDNGDQGYTGIQPREYDKNGNLIGQVHFSFFGKNSKSQDRNCQTGADGGDGTTCYTRFPMRLNTSYEFHVKRTKVDQAAGTETWDGSMTDTASKRNIHIGTWSIPAADGALENKGVAFMEYFTSAPSCEQIPAGAATFSAPKNGNQRGSVEQEPYFTGKTCKDVASYRPENGGMRTALG